eukprot:Sdes_comp16012_c0_seq1m5195
MDINPYKFQADFSSFEFSSFYAHEKPTFIFLLTAWLDSSPDSYFSIFKYWAWRMSPLLGSSAHLIVSNRVGTEVTSTFCGCSCVLSLKEPRLVAFLDKTQESLLKISL